MSTRTIIHPGGSTVYLSAPWPMNELAKLFGVDHLDILELSRGRVMLACDNEDLPINHAATAAYFAGNPYGIERIICGPVAVVPASDFLVAYG